MGKWQAIHSNDIGLEQVVKSVMFLSEVKVLVDDNYPSLI